MRRIDVFAEECFSSSDIITKSHILLCGWESFTNCKIYSHVMFIPKFITKLGKLLHTLMSLRAIHNLYKTQQLCTQAQVKLCCKHKNNALYERYFFIFLSWEKEEEPGKKVNERKEKKGKEEGGC